MTSAALAPLRALVEKVDQLKRAYAVGNYSFLASELFQYLPAAREALERLSAATWQEKEFTSRGPIIQGDAAETTMEGRDE